MAIKWVQVDPLVMNGEPFCYGTRLTVRQLLELRRNGYTLVDQPRTLARLEGSTSSKHALSARKRHLRRNNDYRPQRNAQGGRLPRTR